MPGLQYGGALKLFTTHPQTQSGEAGQAAQARILAQSLIVGRRNHDRRPVHRRHREPHEQRNKCTNRRDCDDQILLVPDGPPQRDDVNLVLTAHRCGLAYVIHTARLSRIQRHPAVRNCWPAWRDATALQSTQGLSHLHNPFGTIHDSAFSVDRGSTAIPNFRLRGASARSPRAACRIRAS